MSELPDTWMTLPFGEVNELPMLLDPTYRADARLIEVEANGQIAPSWTCAGDVKKLRVKRSIEVYGLNLPKLVGARKKAMRDVEADYEVLSELLTEDKDRPALERLQAKLREATMCDAVHAIAARSKLLSLPRGAPLCARPEDESIGVI